MKFSRHNSVSPLPRQSEPRTILERALQPRVPAATHPSHLQVVSFDESESTMKRLTFRAAASVKWTHPTFNLKVFTVTFGDYQEQQISGVVG